MTNQLVKPNPSEKNSPAWSAIWALTLSVSGLMIGEFLPAGLLTPMAADLNITEGMAGQAVTATSIFAVISSLIIAYVTRSANRRAVLLWLSSLLTVSGFIVAYATNFPLLILGRIILGIALGGLWSMAAAIATRLVPSESVSKALAIIFGGASFAAMLAAPMGSYLFTLIGWRNVFVLSGVVGIAGFIWLYKALPSLEPEGVVRLKTTWDVLKIPNFAIGLVAVSLAFCGRFASFTYLRPFLEIETGIHGTMIAIAFLVFDVAYFLGTLYAGKMVAKHLRLSMLLPPVLLAISILSLITAGSHFLPTMILLFVFGGIFGPVPVAWSTWLTRSAPENTETAGGLYVASIQMSAALGAMAGGVAFDVTGSSGVFIMSAVTWVLSAIIVFLKIKNIPSISGESKVTFR